MPTNKKNHITDLKLELLNTTKNYQNCILVFKNLNQYSKDSIINAIESYLENNNDEDLHFLYIVKDIEKDTLCFFSFFKKCISIRTNNSKFKFSLKFDGIETTPDVVYKGKRIDILRILADGFSNKKYLFFLLYDGNEEFKSLEDVIFKNANF